MRKCVYAFDEHGVLPDFVITNEGFALSKGAVRTALVSPGLTAYAPSKPLPGLIRRKGEA
jgi:hypothetical protein